MENTRTYSRMAISGSITTHAIARPTVPQRCPLTKKLVGMTTAAATMVHISNFVSLMVWSTWGSSGVIERTAP